jgi:3-hydroxymyristoyl/3-hydroxydecanoyl-(acyl carrier protein) dehydratase
MDEGRFIQGVKQVTRSDAYVLPSWNKDNTPVLMSSIIGETLGQLGAWCAMHTYNFTLRPVAGVVSAVHIHGEAKVGDTVLLETTVDALDETALEYHSIASVNGTPIFSIESALGPMLPMEDFIDPLEAKRQFEKIYRPDVYENILNIPMTETCLLGKNNQEIIKPHVNFDFIIEHIPGERVVAQKSLSLSASYLSDHFPRKPVLPLTILLQAKLQLASAFVIDAFEDGHEFRPITLRKIKMSGFVQPGDTVVTTLQLKEKTENELVVTYRTEMQGKRVCMAEALFRKD